MTLRPMLRDGDQHNRGAGSVEEALEMVDPSQNGDRIGLGMNRHMPGVGPMPRRAGMTRVDEADDSGKVPSLTAQTADQLPRVSTRADQNHAVGDFTSGGLGRPPINDVLAFAH